MSPNAKSKVKYLRYCILLLVLLTSMVAGTVNAQTPTPTDQVVISAVTVNEAGGKQNISLYYTVTDTQGYLISNPNIVDSSVTVGGQSYPATLSQPTTPSHIVMLIDDSISLSYVAYLVQAAATQAITRAAKGTTFAILTYNDKIVAQQDFTNDPTVLTTFIKGINRYGGGRCIYDAAGTAIDMLRKINAPGSSAVMLFTMGKDQKATGGTCSTSYSVNSLIQHAKELPNTIPIYTIGLNDLGGVDDHELANISTSTGGLTGTDNRRALANMFQRTIDDIGGQKIAQATICVPKGIQTGTLNLTIDGAKITPGTTFQTTTTCSPGTATFTPAPLAVSISAFDFDPVAEALTFKINRTGAGNIDKYHVTIKYKSSNIQIKGDFGDFKVDQPGTITVKTTGIATEPLVVTVDALAPDGTVIAAPATGEVTLGRPTQTPSPAPTFTPTVGSIGLTSFNFSPTAETLTFQIDKGTSQNIAQFRVQVKYKSSNIQIPGDFGDFKVDATGAVSIPTTNIRTEALVITVTPLGADGAPLSLPAESEVTLDRPTATPTVTYTPSSTATSTPAPIKTTLDILGAERDPSSSDIVLNLRIVNGGPVTGYSVRIVNKQGFVAFENTYRTPPTDKLHIAPTNAITSGDYNVTVELIAPGQDPPPSATLAISYTAPVAPTPSLIDNIKASPILAIILGVVAIALILALVFLLIQVIGGRNRKRAYAGPIMVDTDDDVEYQTQVFDGASIANSKGQLTLVASPGMSKGAAWPIDHAIFRLGRKGGKDYKTSIDFDGDKSISRNHATITVDGDKYFIADEGSANGTFVNDERLTPGHPVELNSNAPVTIKLGTDTLLAFSTGPVTKKIGTAATKRIVDNKAINKVDNKATQVEPELPTDRLNQTIDDTSSQPMPANVEARLTILQSEGMPTNQQFPITRTPFKLGREGGQNDIDFKAKVVSRDHARLLFENGKFYLVDMGSVSGTYLDGYEATNKLTPQQNYPLTPDQGHEIGLGKYSTKLQFKYHINTPQAPGSKAKPPIQDTGENTMTDFEA